MRRLRKELSLIIGSGGIVVDFTLMAVPMPGTNTRLEGAPMGVDVVRRRFDDMLFTELVNDSICMGELLKYSLIYMFIEDLRSVCLASS